jgi:hypothetical protein
MYDNQAATKFVVLETRTLATLRTIVLPGAFAFDALSPDGRRLYVTEFPNGVNGPIRYVVRSLSLATGRLDPGAIVDKTEPGEQMTGMPMARAWSRDGGSAYTLYNGLESHAFIHALDTTKRSARCIDLPWRGDGQNGLERVRMAVGQDGVLVLSQPGVGVLARIDTRTFEVEGCATLCDRSLAGEPVERRQQFLVAALLVGDRFLLRLPRPRRDRADGLHDEEEDGCGRRNERDGGRENEPYRRRHR